MSLSEEEIQLLKCLYDHGIYGNHHWKLFVVQKVCHDGIRKGLRKQLQKLLSEGYITTKSMKHFAVTKEGRNFLIESGEI